MKENIRNGLIALGVICLLLTMYFQLQPAYLSTNYKAPGTGTYDQSNNYMLPENISKRVDYLAMMSQNPVPGKAMMAMNTLGRLGSVSESAIPNLEVVADEYPNDRIKALAVETIEKIKAATEADENI